MSWLQKITNLLGTHGSAQRAAAPAGGETIARSGAAVTEFSNGMAAYTSGDYELAARCFNAAIEARHDADDAYYYLGLAYLNLHLVEDAVDSLVMATHFRPAFAPAWYSLALAVRQRGDHREAVRCLERAIMLRPDYAEAHNELGVNALELGDVQGAVASFERAIAIKPDYLRAHSNLGCVLFRYLGEYERGTAHIDTAVGLDKDDSDAQCNYSMVLIHQGRLAEAIAACDRLLAAMPELDDARLNRALALLMQGHFARAWPDYEARKRVRGNYIPRPFKFPEWRYEALVDKAILIYAEQGLGDEIMFSSCVPDLLKLGGRCVLECSPRLENLFRRSFPGATVHGALQSDRDTRWLTQAGRVDYQTAIGSLPGVFRRHWSDFPRHTGYLRADPARVAHWRASVATLGAGFTVGISWRGGTSRTRQSKRSIDLMDWLPMLRRAGCHFVSLQHGTYRAEAEEALQAAGVQVHHWQEAIDDYDETAALVSALDLVISVQTAVVHLAGALGKPVWVMVPAMAEWRYLQSGDTMPWYPSVRLFRQSRADDWKPVIDSVTTELAQWVRS
ncbi:MAG TPA: tetratricopeptide repeat-containing glycosyltransferase family protein [Burkholderiales bacterium]|nr:tetratricopeptide repeat-containing glycosyltransferase family protein [Burkholderiales bacterium]